MLQLKPNWNWLVYGVIVGYFLITPFLIPPLDSDLWINNGQDFIQAILSRNFSQTYVNLEAMHPAVSVMWVTGLSSLIIPIENYRILFYLLFSLLICSLYLLIFKITPKNIFKPIVFSLTIIFTLPISYYSGGLTWLDGMSTPLIFLAVVLLISLLQQSSTKKKIVLGLLTGILLLTRYLYIFLLPMYFFIAWLFDSRATNLIKFIPTFFTIACIACLTFLLCYPAAVINPELVFFNRLSANYSGQTINPIKNSAILLALFEKIVMIHPLINFGFLSFVIELIRHKKNTSIIWVLGGGGAFFLASIYLIIFSLHDAYRGTSGFLGGFNRYILPGEFLLLPYSVQGIKDLKIAKALKVLLIGLFIGYSFINFQPVMHLLFGL